jgi:hypothetical protein
MLDNAYAAVGAGRLLWGADITLCTGLAKLWALEVIGLTPDEMADVRWRNTPRGFSRTYAAMLFPTRNPLLQ